MVRIDAHQHFWSYHPRRDTWITEEMEILKQDFLPDDLLPILQNNKVRGCIAVQANETTLENDFLLHLASKHAFVEGIVGWVDFMEEELEEKLLLYSKTGKIKGFRYMLQGSQDRALMLHPIFQQNLALLKKYHFTYDLLILADQLPYATRLAQNFPGQPFVLDHLAKPDIKNNTSIDWHRDIKELSKHQNVHCKISGLITEADWKHWNKEAIYPYLDYVVNTFGTERIMFGSDWPVCLIAGKYAEVVNLIEDYFSHFSLSEQSAIWGENAIKFYHL